MLNRRNGRGCMRIFLYIFLLSFYLCSSDRERLLLDILSVTKQSVNFKIDKEIQEQIDDLKKIITQTLKPFSQKVKTEDGKKFLNLMNAYVIANLIVLYMIQQSIILESNPDFRNRVFSLVQQGKTVQDINTNFKMLREKYRLAVAPIGEDGLEELKLAISNTKPVSIKDLEMMDLIWINYVQINRAPEMLENLLSEFNLINFGKDVLKALKSEYSLSVSDTYFDELISITNSLLRFKSFLYEDAPLKLRNSLYRFIQLCPLFLILDVIRPTDEVSKILFEMKAQGNQLKQVFDREYTSIVVQSNQQLAKVTQYINQQNLELLDAFNQLLKVLDVDALNVSMQLFAKDLSLLNALI